MATMVRRSDDEYQLHVPMPRELRDRLHIAAAIAHRSMSEHVRYLIDTHTQDQ